MSGASEALWDNLTTAAPLPGGWWPLRLPDGVTLPAGSYQRISTVRPITHSGGTEWAARRYQLAIYSERYAEGLDLARTVAAALNGVRETWDGWDVSAMLRDEAEDIDPEPRGLFRQRVDVMLGTEAP